MNNANLFNFVSLIVNLLTVLLVMTGPSSRLIRREHSLMVAGLVIGSFSLGAQVLQYLSYFLTGNLHVDPQLPLWVGKDIGFALIVAAFVLRANMEKR
jgi:hypothetical protein